jgi:hypothetical protein
MNLTRQGSAPIRGRSILALSLLALLAFCCAPVFAYGSSAGIQYGDAPQTATGKPPSESNLSDGSSSTSGVGSPTGGSGSGGDGSPGAKSPSEAGGSPSKSDGGAGSKDGTGQQGSQAKGGDKAALGTGKQAGSTEPGSDGGGSSPLVPILIAILVLAGGSVAYVMIKRRRGDDPGSTDSSGSPVSPEAS